MLSLVLPILLVVVDAIPIGQSAQGVVGLPIRSLDSPARNNAERLRRRGDSQVSVNLGNQGTYYEVDLEIGTPAQKVSFLLDTGSSDLWVDSNTTHKNSFDTSKSSTFQKNDTTSKFSIGYGDHSQVSGFWATDNMSLNGNKFEGSFGVADHGAAISPIMGIGLAEGEISVSSVDRSGKLSPTYPNFPSLLKINGLIERVAYSLWLKDAKNADGSILFGGVDHSKYKGDSLSLVPVINDRSIPVSKDPTTLSVMLHGANLTDTSGDFHSEANIPVLLDSGSTVCQLPTHFVDRLGSALNGTYSADYGVYKVDCNAAGTVNFNLSGVVIPVEVADLTLPLSTINTEKSGANGCGLGIFKTDTSKYVLGDPFLRNAYVTFDLEGLEVGIAPASGDSSSSDTNIEAIVTGIPSATSAPLYSQTSFATGVVTA